MDDNKLETYRKKRDFSVTGEPAGEVKQSSESPRFCVQHHLARADHYDFRLEWEGVALSWAVPKGPSFCALDKRLAMRVEDHPVDYMSFEGTIPAGEYGGGTVMLWDEGTYSPLLDFDKGLKNGSLKFTLFGERLKGNWALVKIKNSEERGEPWLLIKEKDGYAKETAGIARYTRGVRSGKSMEEIAKSGNTNPFSKADVMLANLTEDLPEGAGWLFELKYDGHRTLAFSEEGKTALRTRNGYDCTQKFLPAAEAVNALLNGRAAVLDGEMIAVGKDGRSDFGALQSYPSHKSGLCYVLFDLLALDGVDLRDRPLTERKERLKALLIGAPPLLKYSEHTERITKTQLKSLKAQGMEGVVIKRADSPYTAGKNGDWLKLKFRNYEEFVIGGYTEGEGSLKSLLLGLYEGRTLTFAGKVGSGFSERTKGELLRKFAPLVQKECPFLPPLREKNAVWLSPKTIAQVEFAERTAAGLLRQASFQGLREDKLPETITAEPPLPAQKRIRSSKTEKKAEGMRVLGVNITHPEKQMFPADGITKGEIAAYYAAAVPRMLPYLKDRLLSLVCCPAGIGGETFFRRRLEGEFAGVGFFSEGFFVKSEKGVLSLAQYNGVEFHVQGVKKGTEKPDVMVFDLDPDEGLPLAKVRKGARELKKTLESLGLTSFLKTSGGKGYHLVVPLRPRADGERFKQFAKGVALLMEERFPDDFTANISKKARTGKIFLDWQRNSESATSVAPYSLRARGGAPVSMPIAWEELSRVAPNGITLKGALKRLKKPDPWADFFEVKQRQTIK